MIVGRQIRAARALLDMSQDELAIAAGLTPQAIRKIEGGDVQPREGTIADITRVFNDRGLEFTENSGVRFRSNDLQVFEGPNQFDLFYDYIYDHLKKFGGDVCVSVTDEHLLAKYRKDPNLHRKRMEELVFRGDVTFKVMAKESDFTSTYAQYKWQDSENHMPTSFYAFGDCLALISFVHHLPPYVVLIRSGPLASAYRESFEAAWKIAKDPPNRKVTP